MQCNAMQCIFYEGDKLGADRPLPITVCEYETVPFHFTKKVNQTLQPNLLFRRLEEIGPLSNRLMAAIYTGYRQTMISNI